MKSYTFTAGAKYRRNFMGMLDEVGLPFTEHRTVSDSTIVIQVDTEAQEDAYNLFVVKVADFAAYLELVKAQKQSKKLARKNRFRKLTFRKPVQRL